MFSRFRSNDNASSHRESLLMEHGAPGDGRPWYRRVHKLSLLIGFLLAAAIASVVLVVLLVPTHKAAPAPGPKPGPSHEASPADRASVIIHVVDEDTGRGIPLVKLTAVSWYVRYTDSNGVAVFFEPSWDGTQIWLTVESDGYEFKKDGFGFRGTKITVQLGAVITLKMRRTMLAQRIYRLTGQDVYKDTVLALGYNTTVPAVPVECPTLNTGVIGQDSIQTATYKGNVHWFWGDTNWVAYPLGSFATTGAQVSSTDLDVAVNISYYSDGKGSQGDPCNAGSFVQHITHVEPQNHPTWVSALFVLSSAGSEQGMFCHFVKVQDLTTQLKFGLAQWNESTHTMDEVTLWPLDDPMVRAVQTNQHAVQRSDGYVYIYNPWAMVRVQASRDSIADIKQYQAYTPLVAGTNITADVKHIQLDRNAQGQLLYAWKAHTPPVDQALQRRLVNASMMNSTERLLQFYDTATGQEVLASAGTFRWNAHVGKYIMFAQQLGGSPSPAGEIFYSTSDSPLLGWRHAVKVVSHPSGYTFYNPVQHDQLPFQGGGRYVYFSGTYNNAFSNVKTPTPQYDYNNVMYKLDVDSVVMPAAVWVRRTSSGSLSAHADILMSHHPAFELEVRSSGAMDDGTRVIGWYAHDKHVAGTQCFVYADGMWRTAQGEDECAASVRRFYAPTESTMTLYRSQYLSQRFGSLKIVPMYQRGGMLHLHGDGDALCMVLDPVL